MKKQILCSIALIFLCRPITNPSSDVFIVWNVGQGAWSTWVLSGVCHHFDMGGTRSDHLHKLRKHCQRKTNVLHLTHFDWDHINLIKKAQRILPELCRTERDLSSANRFKTKWLKQIPPCKTTVWPQIGVLYRSQFKESNESHIYLVANKILITGDASQRYEKLITSARALRSVKILLLGHHGSRTSTSQRLLEALTQTQISISSAEKLKYGHPHNEVLTRLRKHRLPMLSTELYGNIFFDMK